MGEPMTLRRLSETKFDHRVPEGLPKSNPALDLSASWDAAGKNLLIYRPRDQVVSKIHQYARPGTTAPEPLAVSWKSDGQFLAVGWSDGYVRLMGLENNKAAHHIRVCEDASAKITHIGWSRNTVGEPNALGKQSQLEPAAWESAVSEELGGLLLGKRPVLDLPRELTFLEVDSSLPKISPLPAGSAGEGEDAMVFTLRTGIEFLFQEFKPEDSDQVHVMVVGSSDGRLHLSIYDSFVIGDFRYTLPSSMYKPGVMQMVHHASHPAMSTHSLYLKHPADDDRAVYFVPLDLPFVASSPINLALLASKLTTLQKLLRYVKQTQLHMMVEYKNTRELPTRFLRAVSEDLEKMEAGPTDIVQALFHTAVTGHTYDLVKEWLVDNLAERGHKRWDKAVTSGLENLRSLVHENLLPALNRCSIILSRLRGLAQFHSSSRDDAGLSAPQVARAADAVASLTVVAHRILLLVMEELDLFRAFSTWMRFQIDRLAAPSSGGSEELTEREAGMDTGKVLSYIQAHLTQSPMSVYFDESTPEEHEKDWAAVATEGSGGLLNLLDEQAKRQQEGKPHMKELPKVKFLVELLDSRASGIFRDIAEAQKRSVRFGQPTKLVLRGAIARMDSVMVSTPVKDGQGTCTFTTATQKGTENEVYIFCTSLRIVNGISTTASNTVAALQTGNDKITDLKFLNDSSLVILLSNPENQARIIQIPLSSPAISYTPYQEGTLPPPQLLEAVFAGDGEDELRSFSFPVEDASFVPIQMDVHGPTSERGEAPARICLLGRDRATWRVFAMEGQSDADQPPPSVKGKEKHETGGSSGEEGAE